MHVALRLALFLGFTIVVSGCGDDAPTPTPMPDSGTPDLGMPCTTASSCDDGLYCTGVERCAAGEVGADARGCVHGGDPCVAPMVCNESADSCDGDCPDDDGDGHSAAACGGDDCDDADAARFPSNAEVCDLGGHDEDCNPATFGERDIDGDATLDAACCNTSTTGSMTCGTDCDDSRATVNPSTSEVCDGFDNNCDGAVDEGTLVAGFEDADGDLYGNPASPRMACPGNARFVTNSDDCDDTLRTRNLGQAEICDDIDNDCDGVVDEQARAVTWYRDTDGDGFGSAASGTVASCTPVAGHSLIATDCDDASIMVSPIAAERCNGGDDDCNGLADFLLGVGDTEDDDGDLVADSRCPVTPTDCDDLDPFSYPGATELCDGRDNDCNGISDGSTASAMWYVDADRDGFGDDSMAAITSCEPQAGRVPRAGDCNDASGAVRPGANDGCGGVASVDDDCDLMVDEDLGDVAYYLDADGDGWGAGAPVFVCTMPSGRVDRPGDCNDADSFLSPARVEACAGDGLDDDCDGLVDCDDGDCRSVAGCRIDYRIDVVSGNAQSTTVTRALPSPVILRVVQLSDGAPAAGVTVTVRGGPGVGVTPPSAPTDGAGEVSFALRAPLVAGVFAASITADGARSATVNGTATAATVGVVLPVVNVDRMYAPPVDGASTTSTLPYPNDVIAAVDGTLYVSFGCVGDGGIVSVLPSGVLQRIAGGGSVLGDGGPATSARLSCPSGLALDETNRLLYVADTNDGRVRAIDLAGGTIATFAGGGSVGGPSFGDGGPPTDAQLASPTDLVLLADRSLLVGDSRGIRKVDAASGLIDAYSLTTDCSVVADDGTLCLYGPGEAGMPMALDAAGNVFVAAYFRGVSLGSSGAGDYAYAVARRRADGAYVHLAGQSGGGLSEGVASTTVSVEGVSAMAFDSTGNLYLADHSAHRVVRVEARTFRTEFAAGTGAPDSTGDYAAATSAAVNYPQGLAFVPGGHLVVAEGRSGAVRMLRDAARASAGVATLSATAGATQMITIGQQAAALTARLVDGGGTALRGRVLAFEPAATSPGVPLVSERFVQTGLTGSASLTVRAARASGDYVFTAAFRDIHGAHVTGSPASYTVRANDPAAGVIVPFLNAARSPAGAATLDGDPAIGTAPASAIVDIEAAADGTLYVATLYTVYAIDPRGGMRRIVGGGSASTTLVGDMANALSLYTVQGVYLDAARARLYVAAGSRGAFYVELATGQIGSTVALAGLNAYSDSLEDVAVSADGSLLYAVEYGSSPLTGYSLVRVDATGTITDVVARAVSPSCGATSEWQVDSGNRLAFGSTGALYVSATYACGGALGASGVPAIFQRTAAGVISLVTTVAPQSVAFIPLDLDASGNIYFATSDGRLRRWNASGGTVTTLAGITGSTATSTGDFGVATAAALAGPSAVVVLPGGHVAVGETLPTGAAVLRVVW